MSETSSRAAGVARRVPTYRMLVLALMRIAIGWHFLYEGLVKLLDPQWTAAEYLESATGPAAGLFHWLASHAALLRLVEQLNVWGLIVIGACLMLGLFGRAAAAAGIVLLALYYAAQPPLFATAAAGIAEGHYLLVNKNLVELIALSVIAAFPSGAFGLDGILLAGRTKRGREASQAAQPAQARALPGRFSRRSVLAALTGVPLLGGFVLAALKRHGWESHEEMQLAGKVDGHSGATFKTFDFSKSLQDLQGQLPQGRIGELKLSRVILGGNLIGGWAHARDLIYVSKLVKAYHHRWKVFETFKLAEACGVNVILTNPLLCEVINDYWKTTGGKIRFISDCGGKNLLEMIQTSIDNGACACYIQGGIGDQLAAEGKFDLIDKALELIRRNGLPAGIGAHKLETVTACVEKGFEPDFWMKTLHHGNYWSAKPAQKKDNIWCEQPEETVAFMNDLRQPWIAYKVLAAGAIPPRVGFKYAFRGGADFVCVGMYDFQIVEDVNVALAILDGKLERRREWFA